MKELIQYREKLVQRLENAAMEFCSACKAASHPHDPVEADGWSVHQLAVHTRDIDKLVYGMRARRTLAEDNPSFPNFDSETYMTEHYNREEALQLLLDGFAVSVQALVQQLHDMPPEAWSRPSSHETRGSGLTLQTWVEQGLEHIEEHLETVRKAALL